MDTKSADEIYLDSHKMMYHPIEVGKWMEGEYSYPINVEIGLSGACNHRCVFCAFEYLEYKPVYLETGNLLRNLSEMQRRGLKSVLYAGFGEPMLHKDAAEIIHISKTYGIDCALSTNGVGFMPSKQDKCLGDLSWIRFSVASPTNDTYSRIHQCRKGDFDKVVENIKYAVWLRNKMGYKTTLGIQMLMLPSNIAEIPLMAKLGKEIGVDYVSIKPFNQGHKVVKENEVDKKAILELYKEALSYETYEFHVFIRKNLMKQHELQKPKYDKCRMLDFFCMISADGSVIPCTVFPGDEDYVYGNINENSFNEIWSSKKCKEVKHRINYEVFEQYCRSEDCKMRMQNEFLYKLMNPHPHVNFV